MVYICTQVADASAAATRGAGAAHRLARGAGRARYSVGEEAGTGGRSVY